jgi:hypothetical protein
MRVFDRKPRPRVVFWSCPEEVQRQLEEFFPTARRITSFDEIRPKEWELVVTTDGDTSVPDGLFVLSLGGNFFTGPTDTSPYGVGRAQSSVSEELILPDGLPAAIEQLVRSDLLPRARTESRLAIVREYMGQPAGGGSPGIEPLLLTGERLALAGWYTREKGGECWCLPAYSNPVHWTRVLLRRWQERFPEQFPRPWSEQVDWLTADEEHALLRRPALEAERQREVARLDQADAQAELDIAAAADRAAHGARRLLTEQGSELVDAVAAALESLGFTVKNMDAVFSESDRREDLRVRVPERPEWEAIVEVRGYGSGGAAIGDLFKLERYAKRYEQDEKRRPSVVWYICNQFFNQPPSDRPAIFATSGADVAVFDEDRPLLVLDTRTLFQMWKRGHADAAARDAARGTLLATRGVVE